jgi:hypothetical protein
MSKFDFVVLEIKGKFKGLANKSSLLVLQNTAESNRLFDEIMLRIDDYKSKLDEAIECRDYNMLTEVLSDIQMDYKRIKDMLK